MAEASTENDSVYGIFCSAPLRDVCTLTAVLQAGQEDELISNNRPRREAQKKRNCFGAPLLTSAALLCHYRRRRSPGLVNRSQQELHQLLTE